MNCTVESSNISYTICSSCGGHAVREEFLASKSLDELKTVKSIVRCLRRCHVEPNRRPGDRPTTRSKAIDALVKEKMYTNQVHLSLFTNKPKKPTITSKVLAEISANPGLTEAEIFCNLNLSIRNSDIRKLLKKKAIYRIVKGKNFIYFATE